MKSAGNAIMLVRSFSSKRSRLTVSQILNLQIYNEETEYLFGPVISKNKNVEELPPDKETKTSVNKRIASRSTVSSTNDSKYSHSNIRVNQQKSSESGLSKANVIRSGGSPELTSSNNRKYLNNQIKSPEFLKHELSLSENERLVLSHILNMPLFSSHDDQQHSYEFWKGLPMPSVSRIIKDSMSEESLMILARWEQNMISTLGKEGFEKYKLNTFSNGKQLHLHIQNFLEKKQVGNITQGVEGYWNSLQPILKDINNVIALEQMVTNEGLHYRGIFDCVATYQDRPCLIDWKTSQKPKSSLAKTYDQPLQLVAYLSAFNNSMHQGAFENNCCFDQDMLEDLGLHKGSRTIENCLLVISYENGSQADVHLMNRKTCMKYWAQWIHRLHKYWLDFFLIKYKNLTH